MLSIIITAYKEPRTIPAAVEALAKQAPPKSEILVTAPDEETLDAARKLNKKYKFIKCIKDEGKGKPAALNIAVKKAKGNILVLTDGDVAVDEKALAALISPLKDKNIGAVSGRPVSTSPRNTQFGFWAHLLTTIAHEQRLEHLASKEHFFCSGYLFAIRKNLFPKLPEWLLSEDGYISNAVYSKGFSLSYAPEAKVYVKYPDNFSDWIKQKKRSAGGYNQIKKVTGADMRSFKSESLGAFAFFKHIHSVKELFWLGTLFISRIYMWLVIYRDINLYKKSHSEIWQRVESTK